MSQLTSSKEKVAIVLVLGTIACMLLESVIGTKTYPTASVGVCLLALCGVLSEREALGSIHQPTVPPLAGVLALSDAIRITGAGDVMVDWMISLLGNITNPYVIMAVFFIIPFILTQVMSNLATATIFIPLVAIACVKIGVDPRAAAMGVLIASFASTLIPMVTPCQIMIMGLGGCSLKNYPKRGMLLAVMITIVCAFTLPIMFPLY